MLLTAYYEDKKITINEYEDYMRGNIKCDMNHELVAKRGKIKVHHFAHKSDCNCICNRDMSEWHINWQKDLNPSNIEVIIVRNNKKHIADCVNENNKVIEFQKSIISESVIQERENFYRNMIWIFDVSLVEFDIKLKDNYYCELYIISGSKFFLYTKKKTYLDTGKRGIIRVKRVEGLKIYGYIIEYKKFIERYFNNIHHIKYFREDAPLI